MRYLAFAVALTLSLAATADAEQRRGRGRASGNPNHNQPTPRSQALSRNIPPRILLPAGENRFPTDVRFHGARRPPFFNDGRRFNDFNDGRHHGSKWPWWAYYAGSPYLGGYYGGAGYYGGSYYETATTPNYSTVPPPSPEATRITGVLRLDITPTTGLQYYVDGVYIGSSSDLGLEFEINAGARRVEVRANGYKPAIFDVRLAPGGTATFRGALEPLDTVVTTPRPVGNRTMYVIPGCYIGNSPPVASKLPSGCDATKVVTRPGA